MDPYYSRNEISNSDLSWLKKQIYGGPDFDPTEAYKFGTLVDALISERDKVNFLAKTIDGVSYSDEEFAKGNKMRDAFLKDELCSNLLKLSDTQSVMVKTRAFEVEGIKFELPTRCKWDLWSGRLSYGGDIKSTTATTQKQFEEAVKFFDYDRQRAWYMDIAGSNQDILIGISKVNFKVFKLKITRNSELYNSGKAKYEDLAFKWWTLFG